MIKLLVIADDFTGALDTGAQFSKAGVSTFVSTNAKFFTDERLEVLVLDLETRHLPPCEARGRVRDAIVSALRAGIPYVYKKTDSVMRGNIGSELEGLFTSASDGPVFFVPAYPETGRTTRQGVHYIEGVPVSQTVFGNDPFNPVRDDYVPDIIANQTSRPTEVITQQDLNELKNAAQKDKILIFDAADKDEMALVAKAIAALGPPRLMAGCAGFAIYLPEMLRLNISKPEVRALGEGLLVACGSINATTLGQVEYASRHGFTTIELTPKQKLTSRLTETDQGRELLDSLRRRYNENKRLIIMASSGHENIALTNQLAVEMGLDSNQARERIAANMGELIGSLLSVDVGTLAVFGGDTLISVLRAVGEDGIYPIQEIQAGIVHSTFIFQGSSMNLITKSGGFGTQDCILQIDSYTVHQLIK